MCSLSERNLWRHKASPGRPAFLLGSVVALASVLVCAALLPATGCTKFYAEQADKAAYGVVTEKQQLALGGEQAFNINYDPFVVNADQADAEPLLLDGKPIPVGDAPPRTLSLTDCLEISVRNSRSFQTTKEQLYSTALALANLRHNWGRVGGLATADASWTATGKAGKTTKSGAADLTTFFAQKFAQGGVLTLAAGLDAATDFLGIRSTTFGSFIEANFTQPLWRGAWRGFAYEDLYRAERDFAYAILEYQRFTQQFSVNLATRYYRVLQRLDEWNNDKDNLRRVDQTYRFTQAQVAGGMISRVQADQAENNKLNSSSRVEISSQRYRDALDEFKLAMGLPIASSIELDYAELEKLKPLPIPFEEAQAIDVAMRARPDVLSQYANARDAVRDAEIAADAFNPTVNLELNISAPGTSPRKPFRTQLHRHTRSAEIVFDYDLDQTNNRDRYRNALIAQARSDRNLAEFLDNVRLDVRQSYRSLVQSRRNYDIQTKAVELGDRRTRLARIQQKEGLASTRDVLEAEDALRASKNAVTAALVSYATTRLSFLATLGMISVDQQGGIHERSEPEYFDRLQPDGG